MADHNRPLAERGVKAVPLMAHWLASQSFGIDCALVSSAERTRATFALIREEIGSPTVIREEPRIYEASAMRLLAVLRETGEETRTLLMVGHNPGMQELSLVLSGSAADDADARARLKRKYPTSGIAVLEFSGPWGELSPGFATLARFITPAMLGGIDED